MTTTVPTGDSLESTSDIAESAPGRSSASPPSGLARRWLPELGVVVGAFVLFAWRLDRNGLGNSYYAAAARSMTTSWNNFFYGALDPGGYITVDKPPLALWMQAASAKVFGLSTWSLLLPSAVCGALAVWILMATVRRPWGRDAGLVAGVVFAFTPVILAVSRSNNPDVALVLMVVAAAWAMQRAIESGKLHWILLAGAFCGLGFLTKLLAAGLVMPALWLAYIVAAPGSWKRRLGMAAAGGLAFLAVSAVWVGAVELRPLGVRPWIGGSTDGSALDLVFGYNGIGRITGANEVGGGAFGAFTGGGGDAVDQFGGTTGFWRLFNMGMGDQVMWLVPAVVAAGAAGLVYVAKRARRDARLGSALMWTGWALTVYLLFAFASGTFHNYYVSLLAPAMATLIGVGFALARLAPRAWQVFAFLALGATAVLELVLLRRVDAWQFLRVAVPVAVGACVIIGLVALARGSQGRRVSLGSMAAALVVLLLAPAAWSWSGTQHAQSGTFPDARPGAAGSSGLPGGAGFPGGGGLTGGTLDGHMLTWLDEQRTDERWIVGVASSMEASQAIIDGYDVVALGGFSGSDRSSAPERVADLIDSGELRFIHAGGGFGGGIGGFGGAGPATITAECTAVDASAWGGTGTSNLFDCAGKADAIRAATP